MTEDQFIVPFPQPKADESGPVVAQFALRPDVRRRLRAEGHLQGGLEDDDDRGSDTPRD